MSKSVLYHTDSRLCTAMHRINGVMQQRTFTGKNLKVIITQMINHIDKLGDLGDTRHEQTNTLLTACKIMADRKVVTKADDGCGIYTLSRGPKAPRPKSSRSKTQRHAGHRRLTPATT